MLPIPDVERDDLGVTGGTLGASQVAARWYTGRLGVAVASADLVKGDLAVGICGARVASDLCLRQPGHAGAHLPLQFSDPSGHVWRLLASFELPEA